MRTLFYMFIFLKGQSLTFNLFYIQWAFILLLQRLVPQKEGSRFLGLRLFGDQYGPIAQKKRGGGNIHIQKNIEFKLPL